MGDIETGRFKRLSRLGKLGLKAASSKLRGKGGQQFLAEAMVAELGKMKGLPMKVGQILSYMDGVVADEHQASFTTALATLRAQAPVVDNAACLRILTEELGAPPHEVFESFDETPIASASIGQVYGARYRGSDVVVKVQYPGVREATSADMKNLDGMMGVLKTLAPTMDVQSILDNFKERLDEEFDYVSEARWQNAFAEIYSGDADLVVPRVLDGLSGTRVLVSERVDGQLFEAFLDDASVTERNQVAMSLFRFAFGSLLQHGLFHADPHPGNMFFRSAGSKTAIIDFGCVQPFSASAVRRIGVLLRAGAEGRELRAPLVDALGLDVDEETLGAIESVTRLMLRPVSDEQPYTFTRPFAADISRQVMRTKLQMQSRLLMRKSRFGAREDGLMFVVRNLFGLATLWGQLGATGDFRAELLRMLDAQDASDWDVAEAARLATAPVPSGG